jgi:hypothetical protein
MASSIEELLAARKQKAEKLSKKIDSEGKGASRDPDARFWTMAHLKDETGSGKAVIRFLPAPPNEDNEYVTYYGYGEKNPTTGKYYFHNSHRSFDGDAKDPAYEYNGKIYSRQDLSKDEKKALSIRRQTHYVSNILVVDDPTEPENNGKVFLFDYGPMIMALIQTRIKPTASDDYTDSVIPFDPIDGCNLKIKIISKKLNNQLVPNYEKSTWEDPTPLADTPAEMEQIWKKCYSLKEFVDPENVSMYKPLSKQYADFAKWLGEDEEHDEKPAKAPPSASKAKASKPTPQVKVDEDDDEIPFEAPAKGKILDEDDDNDDFFSKFK